jgi:hypothetical protein
MLAADESAYHVAAHPTEPNHAQVHTHTSFWNWLPTVQASNIS